MDSPVSAIEEHGGGLRVYLMIPRQPGLGALSTEICALTGLPYLQLIATDGPESTPDAPAELPDCPAVDNSAPEPEALAADFDFEAERKALLASAMAEAAAYVAENPQTAPKSEPLVGGFRRKAPVGPKFRPEAGHQVIFGKPTARTVVNIADLDGESGHVTVAGEITFSETRKLNGRDSTILTFDVYDGTGSVRMTKFMEGAQAKQLYSHLGRGTNVIVQGQVRYSSFDQEDQITPTAILRGEATVRTDNAPEKRVELHLHTTMSSMDSLVDTRKAIELAASMGHTAVAITDHGVAQAFPDAMMAASDMKRAGMPIKVLYGVEAYCINDTSNARVVKGYSDAALDDEIVVFDLETTGLSPQSCEIIEIAAAIVCKGEVLDEYHTYVRPSAFIPYKITELTGITDAMVADAPTLDAALPEFLAFAGERPLCAHNADFDISFLRHGCAELGIDRQFCSIDTVALSRVVLPHLPRHRLNDLATAFGLTFRHHQARDDTRVLAKIFIQLIDMLQQKYPMERVLELNDAAVAITTGEGRRGGPKLHHLIILARNREGLIALYKLISDAHLRHYKNKRPIIPMTQLQEVREHLILGSACEAGELYTALLQSADWNELKKIARFYDFLEIQPCGNNKFLIDNGTLKDIKQLQELNARIVKLGEQLSIPVCATGDVHFLNPEEALFREIIQTGMGFEDAQNQAPLYFKSTEEMLHDFAYLGPKKAKEVVITNPNAIADQCEEIQPVLSGTYPPVIEGSAEEIETMSRCKAVELYGVDGKLPDVVAQRLDAELTPIIQNGFDVMYLIAQKLVAKSRENGYLVGSRGSVGSSLVAFLTGITEVNALEPHYRCTGCNYSEFDLSGTYQTGVDMPDKNCPHCGEKLYKDGFNIPFATFLGFDADKQPDIDLNFSGEYQAQAHRDTIELFGEDYVFRAGTIGTIKEKTAFGYVKKYLEEKGLTVGKAEQNRLVLGCTGIKRTTGQHPGGLIVLPRGRTIYEFCPVQHPADDPDSDIITTHFDYHAIHDNLLKLDLLGHDDPTMIRQLHDLTGIDPTTVPLDDPATMAIFTDIEALGIKTDDILEQTGAAGIPEFGTKFVRGMLMETRPKDFDGLLRISGLSHGTNVWRNNAQDLVRAGTAKLSQLICVRDDITIYLIQRGLAPKLAFTISESVRKGRGLKPDWEAEMKTHKVPQWYIDSCNKIEYMFPRAHAVAYVMMAFRIAWFKVHHPLAYYAAYFTVRAPGFDATTMIHGDGRASAEYRRLKEQGKRTGAEDDALSTLEVVHEFYRRGFTFAPMDIYESQVAGFAIRDGALLPPFTSLPGLGESAAQSIVEARKAGPFSSIEDLKLRCEKLNDTLAEKLREIGALGSLPKSEQLDLFEMLGDA